MSIKFTHLHLHSHYSILDGVIRIDELLDKCKEYGMDSVALTDSNTICGALEFYEKAKAAGIKPIVGCEIYITPKDCFCLEGIAEHKGYPLVLLAMNFIGYQNLVRLSTIIQLENCTHAPQIDLDTLKRHSEGLIALISCTEGEISSLIIKDDMDSAQARAKEYQQIFGDRLYFELQENGLARQQKINWGMKLLAREIGGKLVAANNCYYLNKEDAYAHEVLLCIREEKTIADPAHPQLPTNEFYVKSPQMMAENFSHCPEAIANTQEIVERCNLELPFKGAFSPDISIAQEETIEIRFRKACLDGLEFRFAQMRDAGTYNDEVSVKYKERLNMETDIICKAGFSAYFLTVADFVLWAKKHNIAVGPERDSAAGSLAAFCMQITNIDPILYGLLFEIFFNEKLRTAPDFVIDFCGERKGEVIEYIHGKYGKTAAHIGAYKKMSLQDCLYLAGQVIGIPLSVVDEVVKLVSYQINKTDMAVKSILHLNPALDEMAAADSQIKKLLTVAQTLEGTLCQITTNSAGIVVAPETMDHFSPLIWSSKEEITDSQGEILHFTKGEIVTQYDAGQLKKARLTPFYFLGLKALTVIDKTLKNIEADTKTTVNLDRIPLDDKKTYELLKKGESCGVFQMESVGMQEFISQLAPQRLSDLIAINALYRPAFLQSGMKDDFINARHGRKKAGYPLPQLKDILQETYGIIVYQEQIMQIANIVAGYTMSDAVTFYKVMKKNNPAMVAEEKDFFISSANRLGIPAGTSEYVFNLIAKYVGLSINKSHSTAYALISYQTAWLKAHYLQQFMSALIFSYRDNKDRVNYYINECRKYGIQYPEI